MISNHYKTINQDEKNLMTTSSLLTKTACDVFILPILVLEKPFSCQVVRKDFLLTRSVIIAFVFGAL